MKVAILYICTGKYNQFFNGFYESSEKYFLKGIADIEYFVFTDDLSLSTAENVHMFERQCKGFPLDSLLRFDMFLSIRNYLEGFDYVFFFNANMQIVKEIGIDFLPQKEGLMSVIHPGYYKSKNALKPFERNKDSKAFIRREKNKTYTYYMGSLNGGKTADFIKLAEVCSLNVHADLDRDIVAIYHDESHLNKYLSDHECHSLSPAYAYPEGKSIPFTPLIIIRDKTKFDNYFNKGRDHSLKGKMIKACKVLIHAIKWYV